MFSMSDYFENDKLIFQETLIDNLFDYLDLTKLEQRLSLGRGFFELKKEIYNELNIYIEFYLHKDSSIKVIWGEYEKPNTINIYLPRSKEDFIKLKNKDLLNVFFHEFSHLITDKKVPQLVYCKNKQIKTSLIPPHPEDIHFEETNKNKIKSLLDYIFQLRELPNFSLSIAYDLINVNRKLTTDNILKKNKDIILKNSIIDRNMYYINLKEDLKLLFQLQYFTNKIKESKYQRKLIKMKKLIEKYRRRLLIYIK